METVTMAEVTRRNRDRCRTSYVRSWL